MRRVKLTDSFEREERERGREGEGEGEGESSAKSLYNSKKN